MLLDEIKDLIKDFEMVLIKDKRFKEDADFKNQVKTIYNCEKNLNKNFAIPALPSIDVTPFVLSNLASISKPSEITKPFGPGNTSSFNVEDCEKIIEQLKLSIKKLLEQIEKAHQESGKISTVGSSSTIFDEIRSLIEQGRLDEANQKLESIK